MATNTVYEQIPFVGEVKKFVEKYGLKISWLAKQVNISNGSLSEFINMKSILYQPQKERLEKFISEFEKRMNGFI